MEFDWDYRGRLTVMSVLFNLYFGYSIQNIVRESNTYTSIVRIT